MYPLYYNFFCEDPWTETYNTNIFNKEIMFGVCHRVIFLSVQNRHIDYLITYFCFSQVMFVHVGTWNTHTSITWCIQLWSVEKLTRINHLKDNSSYPKLSGEWNENDHQELAKMDFLWRHNMWDHHLITFHKPTQTEWKMKASTAFSLQRV